MVDNKSCFILRNRESIKLRKELTPKEGAVTSLADVHVSGGTWDVKQRETANTGCAGPVLCQRHLEKVNSASAECP